MINFAFEVNEEEQTYCIFLDFWKAFDTISHPLLLNKPETLHIHSNVIRWVENYLLEHRQCLVLSGQKFW